MASRDVVSAGSWAIGLAPGVRRAIRREYESRLTYRDCGSYWETSYTAANEWLEAEWRAATGSGESTAATVRAR